MTQQPQALPGDTLAWPWSITLANYDRSPVLTAAERAELDRIVGTSKRLVSPRTKSILQRLIEPLDDILLPFCTSRYNRSNTCDARRSILIEVHSRQRTYWDWAIEEWCESIGQSWQVFQHRYGKAPGSAGGGRSFLPLFTYLLCPHLPLDPLFEYVEIVPLADKILGRQAIDAAVSQLLTVLQSWGYRQKDQRANLTRCVSYLLLRSRSSSLKAITTNLLEDVAQNCPLGAIQRPLLQVSYALHAIGLIDRTIAATSYAKPVVVGTDGSISDEWLSWCQRWLKHSPFALQTKRKYYYHLLKVGRWLKVNHPEVSSPAQWTYELAAEFVAVVMEMKVGEWIDTQAVRMARDRFGQPLRPSAKDHFLRAIITFVSNCQEWGWIPPQINPHRAFRPPPSLTNLLGSNPRVIEKELWAKLLWAAMNLRVDDLPQFCPEMTSYPVEMVRAVALVWCFAALRSDEIRRLRVGCIRWQYEDVMVPETGEMLPRDAVCFLDIPVNKTSTAYTKPVHTLVGKRINEWEQVRPHEQLQALDKKTGELVHFLFSYRGMQISPQYINHSLIPLLCRKAGIPEQDSRGHITSHRARATIASMLYNAKEPLSIFELKEYLGHKHLSSTQYYLNVDPTKLASKVAKTGYLEQNLATIEVLLDQDAVISGAAARGEVWKYYDLGHGYCTNTFWAECKHRMACARCPFYRPKTSTMEQLVEGKANLLRMLEFVSLTEEEQMLVTEGIDLHQALIDKLVDVPTPAGPTPRELEAQQQEGTRVISMKALRRSTRKSQDEHRIGEK